MSDPRKIDRADVIEVLWPLNGPHTATSITTASIAIAQLWRYLAHATLCSDKEGLAAPADVYAVIGNLAISGNSAAQVLSQLRKWTEWVKLLPTLAHDEDLPRELARGTVSIAGFALGSAASEFDVVAQQLYKAAAVLSHLYLDSDDVEESGR
ncbi:hypothetical protein [Nocardia sp. NPDC004722]